MAALSQISDEILETKKRNLVKYNIGSDNQILISYFVCCCQSINSGIEIGH